MTPPVNTDDPWPTWVNKGTHKGATKRRALDRCRQTDGTIRGYYSDLPMDPTLPETHSLYPSVEHLSSPGNHKDVVVEARIINDMKSHLSEAEFWQVVEHLFAVGALKGQIPIPQPRLLASAWSPTRHY